MSLPGDTIWYQAVGCPECGNTGYRGRTGLYEVTEMTPELRAAILRNAPREELRQLAADQRMLVTEGIRKAMEGLCSLDGVVSLIQYCDKSRA